MGKINNSGKLLLRAAVILLLITIGTLMFYSCSLLGFVSKTERINMFIDDLNSSKGDQTSTDRIMTNFSKNMQMYEQIKTADWWESSILGSANQDFSVTGLSESETDNTVTGHITSEGGLDGDINFIMVSDPDNYFSWLIGGIAITDSSGTAILTIN